MSNPRIYHPAHNFLNQPYADLSNLELTLNELQAAASSPNQIYSHMSPSNFVYNNVTSSQNTPPFNDNLVLNGMSQEMFYPLLSNSPPNTSMNGFFDPLLPYLSTPFNAPNVAGPVPTPETNSDSELISELLNLPSSPNYVESTPAVIKKEPAKRKASSVISSQDIDMEGSEDPAARKRRQNTLAARRSRQRKVAKMEELELSISGLEKEKIQLETKIAILESEKETTQRREQEQMDRIRTLEKQLMEAIKANRS